jgi:hypothetical protein
MSISKNACILLCLASSFITDEPIHAQQIDVNGFTKADSIKREKAKQLAIIGWQKRYDCTKPNDKKIEAEKAAKEKIKKKHKKYQI